MEAPKRASQVKAQSVTWLWADRIPAGMFTLIAGRPGQGKSMLTAYLAADVSRKGGNVLFANAEDDEESVTKPRLAAAGAALDRVFFASPRLPDDLDALGGFIRDEAIRLVILDPVAAHFTVRIYSDQDARKALSPLTKLLSQTGCSVIGVHHLTKMSTGTQHPLQAIGGSSGGLTGAARAVFVFGPNPRDDDERVLAPAKQNLGPNKAPVAFEIEEVELASDDGKDLIEVAKLSLVGESPNVTANEVVGYTGSKSGNSGALAKRAIAAEWLTKYLALGQAPVTEVREDAVQSGFSWSTIRRAADEVGVEKPRHGFGPGSYVVWQLPDGHPALLGDGRDDLDEELAELLGGVDDGEEGDDE